MILTGAPPSSSVHPAAPDLLDGFTEPVARFAALTTKHTPTISTSSVPGTTTSRSAVWRSIPLHRHHIPTGFSQTYHLNAAADDGHFFTLARDRFDIEVLSEGESADTAAAESLLSQFYEYSLAMHDDVPSSQLAPHATDSATSQATTDSSFYSSREDDEESSLRAAKPPLALPPHAAAAQHLSDLDDIPKAPQLLSLHPQTVTANLIVGLISLSPARAVRTRWGATRHLVEVLVGDDTRAGFAVTFWLPSSSSAVDGGGPLAGLRVADVVLMRHVALHVFAGRVYGSSLRGGFTRVHLLYRRRLGSEDVAGYYGARDLEAGEPHPQLEKTRRVRDWVVRFVRQGEGEEKEESIRRKKGKGPAALRSWDVPPPDETQ